MRSPDSTSPLARLVRGLTVLLEYAIVIGLLLFALDVFVHTVKYAVDYGHQSYPQSVVNGIDGIMIVIIILDIVHTVYGHLRDAVFPIRPFLAVGVLAGVRDILSSSARLTLGARLSATQFRETMISLAGGVGVVLLLLLSLWILARNTSAASASPELDV